MRYYMVTATFKGILHKDCEGRFIPESDRDIVEMERKFSVWASDEVIARNQGSIQFSHMAGSWEDTTVVADSETITARAMTQDEVKAMHEVFNK